MHHDFRRIGDAGQAVLRETRRAVTPFGGLVVMVELLRKLRVVEAVRERLPFQYHSNNAIDPAHTLLAFWLGVMAGARRFSHLQMLRSDRALQALCGTRFPGDDAVRNFFRRFGPAHNAAFFPGLFRWLLEQRPPAGCLLDLDSTLLQRFGHQEGAEHGYNPTRRSGRTHRPLVAFLSQPVLVLHAWLRAGHAADNRGAVEFLTEALHNLPAGCPLAGVRADGAFFDQKLLGFLEARALPYVIVVRRNSTVQRLVRNLGTWTTVAPGAEVAEFTEQLPAASRPRRFLAVRLRLPDPTEQRLLAVPGYDYRIFVTNRSEDPEWLWHHYDERAAIEPRFSELKSDLGADDFCLQQFFPTEAAFLAVLFAFNLLSLLQAIEPPRPGRQQRPATLRHSLFACGAIAGRSGHKFVLFLSSAWGGLHARKPLLDKIQHTDFPMSPTLSATLSTAPP
jgi:Transposase DDE domain group 1